MFRILIIENIKGNAWNTYSTNYTPVGNNSLDGTLLKYGFNILEIAGEYSPMDLPVLGNSMPLTLVGDYAQNLATEQPHQ